ncbi:ribosomal RNA assembly protein krr1 [Dimargaris cristalligena]|uniref:KRR1 small subunit processome component n=1 Tax=Dimargaris cristalligena TaxID=215637 RepID=A0A4P9ZPS8_9FUNG|nr:ribosomal RNA assembly protein krr1 [Dimargaris cristalligena]RKP35208.1 hypothetical protein BJ085DRAFT_37864 [Dimargaris cristalligena]|eukprot:RKP35208.1 hypothetical protein BJ085DRAFT_37864 [Dimargaris cristalligena]
MSTTEADQKYLDAPKPVSKKRANRKEKPWDTPDINKWEIVKISAEDVKGSFTEESSFATLFPKYREEYISSIWPFATQALKKLGIASELDTEEGSMTVKTTNKTFDPYIILKARDLIKLVARGVPLANSLRVLEDEVVCDVIKIGNLLRNKDRFIKRRERILGPNKNTLKALEIVTGCQLFVSGNTVCAIGNYVGIKDARRVVLDCMNNIHPIHHIKQLMIKRELAKDEKLRETNWDRFLPRFKKNKQPKSAQPKIKKRQKKEYVPFPPAPALSKVDQQLESGEYFMKAADKAKADQEKKREKQIENSMKRYEERQKAFIAPDEATADHKRKRDQTPADRTQENQNAIEQLRQKFAQEGKQKSKSRRTGEQSGHFGKTIRMDEVQDYIGS